LLNIFLSDVLVIIYEAICVARVRVGRVANLCVSRSATMHLILTREMRGSQIVQRNLDSIRMMIVTCYLVSGTYVSFVRDFGSVTLLFSGTPILGA
jgi:hypothetical protein